MNKTQVIKEWLEKGNTITDMKAVEIANSYRLSSIIHELRHRYGMDIRDRWIEEKARWIIFNKPEFNRASKTKYKEYYLHKEKEDEM